MNTAGNVLMAMAGWLLLAVSFGPFVATAIMVAVTL
jgi:hypothetical protein